MYARSTGELPLFRATLTTTLATVFEYNHGDHHVVQHLVDGLCRKHDTARGGKS